MKKYRLKKWYPSLGIHAVEGIIIERKEPNNLYVFGELCIPKHEVENNPDFWEEVKQPLFVTDDGVELFNESDKLFIVNKEYYKKESKISNLYDKANRKYFKYFFHESNADEYIWRNKPVFSYEDFIKWANDINASFEELSQLAIERSKE